MACVESDLKHTGQCFDIEERRAFLCGLDPANAVPCPNCFIDLQQRIRPIEMMLLS